MKKILSAVYILLSLVLLAPALDTHAQSVGINDDGSQPHPSAILDVNSISKGLLIPRMSTADRSLISSPATGLLVFDTDLASFQFYNGTGWVELSTGSSTNFWTQNASHIFNNNIGNVGIGINNPPYRFTVQTATRNYGFAHTDGNITVASYVGSSLLGGGDAGWFGTVSNHPLNIFTNDGSAQVTFKTDFGMDLKGTKPYIQWYDGSVVSGYIQSSGANLELSGKKVLAAGTPGNLILQADDIVTPVFSSQYAGNVGIGTRGPVGKLHIVHAGPTAHLILEFPGLNDYSRLLFANTGGSRYWGIAGKTSNGNIANDRLSFYNISTGFETMVMTGDGYVAVNGKMGIGTFNPDYKFSVNGNIRSKEVVVESGWADYVFDETHTLSSLDEVEKYIQQNKHLPGIPSANDIQKNGLPLSEMQTKMMEKIEELTLYVIQLKKEIDQLKAEKNENK